MTIAMTEQGVLSPTGSCKTFDAAADGYARGEAINAIYIKRLDDAIRDGDPIRAVIRSTAINCDGKTPGMACPSSESQEQLIRRAYKAAQIREIGTTAYFECHGTGTAVGDPLETAAIANIVDRTGTYIGSVKPNVGHSEGAAGITSLIKAVLSLEHKMIPPNINFSTPNPKIAFERAKLKVPLVPTRWPDNRPQRVSVNSFGIGGANAHVVLDSAASFINFDNSAKDVVCSRPNLLVFSGNNVDSLRRNVTNIQGYVTLYPGKTTDVAHTLGLRRDHLTHRAFAVACKDSELAMSSFQKVRSHTPCLAFVFTGQSSQWQGMGVQLMQCFKSFRQDINKMDKVLSGLEVGPTWTIADEIMRDISTTQIDKAEIRSHSALPSRLDLSISSGNGVSVRLKSWDTLVVKSQLHMLQTQLQLKPPLSLRIIVVRLPNCKNDQARWLQLGSAGTKLSSFSRKE
jgi:acyl transferase domain-containing protein